MRKLLRRIPLFRTGRYVAIGLMSNIFPGIIKTGTGGTDSARYCYSAWMRHLHYLSKCGMTNVPKTIAELGPGDSLGIGLCAMLSGADRYYALDIVEHAYNERNQAIFEELVVMFRNRDEIPDNNEFPRIKPLIDDYGFPFHILSDDLLKRTLKEDRIEQIRQSLKGLHVNKFVQTGINISYIVPWMDYTDELSNVGLIFSQACLEHIDKLDEAYKSMSMILDENGFMSHQIGFVSHGITVEWNGHWALSDFIWRMIRGKRPYLINREPMAKHLTLMEKYDFKVLIIKRTINKDGIPYTKRSKRFKNMTEEDFETLSAFVVLQK